MVKKRVRFHCSDDKHKKRITKTHNWYNKREICINLNLWLCELDGGRLPERFLFDDAKQFAFVCVFLLIRSLFSGRAIFIPLFRRNGSAHLRDFCPHQQFLFHFIWNTLKIFRWLIWKPAYEKLWIGDTQKNTHTHKAPLNPKQFYQKVKKSRYCYCETWWWNCNVSWEKNAAFIFNLVVHEAEKDAVPIVRPQNAWVTFKLKCFWCLVLTGAIIISLIWNARSVIWMCALRMGSSMMPKKKWN